ncbi:PhnD/SsuA/transferrin family substrate-binding protein, partial [candidate division FCPU426 bacterium]|nr:PhnD/SsuA/transferrin family substrate-binding protein [candidate division FCPU426 bacterium]
EDQAAATAPAPAKKRMPSVIHFQEDTVILALETNVLADRWNIQEAMSKAESLLKYFQGKTGMKLKLQRFARTDDLQKTLARGQADLVIGAAGTLKKWEKQNLLRPLVSVSRQNSAGDLLVLCAREGEKILQPSDCKGLRLGYVQGEEFNDVKRLFFKDLTQRTWGSFFRSSQQYPGTRACFLALQMKEIDVMVSWLALYESYREREADMIRGVGIVARAQTTIPFAPVCIRTTISPAKLKAVHLLYQAALRMHNDPDGLAALLSLGFDRVVPATPAAE